MKTKQPSWKFTANIGDVNPFEHGRLLYVDSTGVYEPELVIFDNYHEEKKIKVSRISCDRCTLQNNDPLTLSDNQYHADKPAWFANKLQSVADFVGQDVMTVAHDLCGSDPVARAIQYDNLVSYFGIYEFDSYPVEMTRSDVRKQYRAAFNQ